MVKKPFDGERLIGYLMSHSAANPSESVLNAQNMVTRLADRAALRTEIYEANKPAAAIAAEKPADTLTLDQIKMIAQAIKRVRLRKVAAT
jgi:hypothetical protein